MAVAQTLQLGGIESSASGAITSATSPTADGSNRRARNGRIWGTAPSGGRQARRWFRESHRTIAADRAPADRSPRNFRGVLGVLAATPPHHHLRSRRVPDAARAPPDPVDRAIRRPARAARRPAPAGRRAGRRREGLTMEAKALLAGHARIGSWMAVSVRLKNDGPPIVGELRLGDDQGTTRYGVAVDLPTQSDKTYVLHAQPPAFGRETRRHARRWDDDARHPEGDLHDPRQQPARRRDHRRTSAGPRLVHRPAAEPEPGRAGRPAARGRQPARPGRGLAGLRSARLAGRGQRLAEHGPAGRAAQLGRRRRTPRHRRGQHRTRRPRRVPRRPPAVPPGRHDGRARRRRSPASSARLRPTRRTCPP